MAKTTDIPSLTLNDGNKFPILGFGTWAWEGSGQRSAIRDAVYQAIAAGYRHIDTAWMYKVEDQVGQAVHQAITEGIVKREELTIVTKVWPTHFTAEKVKQSARESNEKLSLGYIDVLLLHFPVPMKDLPPVADGTSVFPLNPDGSVAYDDDVDLYGETWTAMESLVDSGITKSIGVSNFSSQQIEDLVLKARIKPVVNQVECHPLLPQVKVLETCRKYGIIVTAYSPFGGSPRPQGQGNFHESDVRKRLFDPESLVNQIASKYGKSGSQILLKFHTSRGVAVIPKSVTKDRIIGNMQIFDFELTEEEIKSLCDLGKANPVRMVMIEGIEKSKYYPYTD